MLKTHQLFYSTLCEAELKITDILSIAIPILCVLLTLLLTIFLSFISDKRKLRYEMKKYSFESDLKFLYLLIELKTKYNNGENFNEATISDYLLKLESFNNISPFIINQWTIFYDFLLAIRLNFEDMSARRKNVYNFYKQQKFKIKKISSFENTNDEVVKNEQLVIKYEINYVVKKIRRI